jgi:hypothetical protein
MLLVATNGKMDFYKCLCCRHIESHNIDDTISEIKEESNITNNSSLNKNTSYIKLDIDDAAIYNFNITSSSAVNIELYDVSLNQINITKTITNSNRNISFEKYLFSGIYYIKCTFLNNITSGTISTNIVGEPHSHAYNNTYTWIDTTTHRALCSCGASIIQGHAVLKGQSICVSCGGIADMGFIQMSINSNLITKVTINGSYILPNGIIVLDEKDLQSYLNNTLVFYDKNEIPLIE